MRRVEFAGYTWEAKSSVAAVAPGPNHFSGSTSNVRVDANGSLRLALTHTNARWFSAEVVNAHVLGYGSYRFDLGSAVHDLDPRVVLGLFTWSDEPIDNHRELDIEFSRWGDALDPTNGQYVVQPYDRAGNLQRFTQESASTFSAGFDWRPGTVTFANAAATPAKWTRRGAAVPLAGSQHVRMNLWLYRGLPPTDGGRVEVVIDDFVFTDAAAL